MAQMKERRPPPGANPAKPKLTAAERRAGRAAEVARRQRQRRQRTLIAAVVGATVVALLVVLFLRNQAATRVGEAVASEGQGHVNDGTALTFRHYPPSSGAHYPQAQPAGVFRQEVPVGNWVHSLEHGYIVAAVNCTENCTALFNQLDAVSKALPNSKYGSVKFVVVKYGGQYTDGAVPVTLLAWGYELRLDTVDQDQITRFYTRYVDKGPEDVP